MKTYRYVDGCFQTELEVKRSRFIASIKGEVDEDGAEKFVRETKHKYSDATHNCYAYISDISGAVARFSDDGEPSGTAGQPILNVLQKQNLARTAAVVTRYYGGIKLGAGGLVGAYTDAIVNALNDAKFAVKTECKEIVISADYPKFALFDNFIRRNAKIQNIEYGSKVKCSIFVACDGVDTVISEIKSRVGGDIEIAVGKIEYIVL